MNKCSNLAAAAMALLMGCGSTSSGTAGTGGAAGSGGAGGTAARTCASDIAVSEVQPFGEPTPMRTEGITFDADGNLFVSALFNDDADDQLLSISTALSIILRWAYCVAPILTT